MTLFKALQGPNQLRSEQIMVMLCIQLMEAVHDEVKVLHNDLKCNSVLICDSITDASPSSEPCVQIVVIDFGKATSIENGKHYHLNEIEKAEYVRRYSHIAPEVIEGITRSTTMSDMYAVGGILHRILGSDILTSSKKKAMDELATKCRSPRYFSRPTAQQGLESLKVIL